MTPNQVVAWNLAEARRLRRWTQEEAAERIAPYLGVRWSKAVFSAAERSVDGGRIRPFDADELLAFSRAFNLPIWWFLVPPGTSRPDWTPPGLSIIQEARIQIGELAALIGVAQ